MRCRRTRLGDNPANLCFGNTEATLGPLTLPAGGATFDTYKECDVARKTLRTGGPTEAVQVTDALSNRFGEQELMLNIKAHHSLGGGRWRVLGGYEIQRLRYRTFATRQADAVDPNSGAATKVPNAISRLEREAQQSAVSGLAGGGVSIRQSRRAGWGPLAPCQRAPGVRLRIAGRTRGRTKATQRSVFRRCAACVSRGAGGGAGRTAHPGRRDRSRSGRGTF